MGKFSIAILLLFSGLMAGCSLIAKELDSTWTGDKSVYEKSIPLPPLEVSPELAATRSKAK